MQESRTSTNDIRDSSLNFSVLSILKYNHSYLWSNIKGSLLSELLTAINDFFLGTFKNIFRIIRQMLSSIKSAFKIILSTDKNISWGERIFEAAKILAADIVGIIGFSLNELIAKGLMSIGIPFASFIAECLTGLFAGIMSAIVIMLFDKFKKHFMTRSVAVQKLQQRSRLMCVHSAQIQISSLQLDLKIMETYNFIGQVFSSMQELANELKNLSNEITYGQNELQEILNSLDTSSLEVTIRRRWWGGTDHESIKEGFENVYSNLSNYIGKCGKALQQTNENLGRTLELIKLLALVEKELYEHIENQTVSNNELKTVIHDWFRKQGIRDEEVKELLETSFKRAYTLRDRLNALRQENEESIARLEERITALEKKQSSNNVKTILSNTGGTNNNSLGSAVGWTLIGSAIIPGIVSYLITAII